MTAVAKGANRASRWALVSPTPARPAADAIPAAGVSPAVAGLPVEALPLSVAVDIVVVRVVRVGEREDERIGDPAYSVAKVFLAPSESRRGSVKKPAIGFDALFAFLRDTLLLFLFLFFLRGRARVNGHVRAKCGN